jgi:hypothetical protein
MLARMDARTGKHHELGEEISDEARALAETITAKRDRLLASLTLIAGIAVVVAIVLVSIVESIVGLKGMILGL